jgi:hypothetical protein
MGLSDVGYARGYVWDVNTLQWVKMQQPILEAGDITVGGSVSVSNTAFGVTGDVAVTNSATAGKTKLLTTPDNPSNLDVALSTRLKPADTLTKVSTVDTITNSVAVTNSGLSNIPTDPAKESGHLATIDTSTATTATASANLDVALSTRLKPADTLTAVTTVSTITNPVQISGLVSDSPESYISNAVQPLSLTSDGRLRVSSMAATSDLDFFGDFNLWDGNLFGIVNPGVTCSDCTFFGD